MLTQEKLRQALDYDPLTGVFRWKVRSRKIMLGSIAGHYEKYGYIHIGLNDKVYRAHQLAWLYVYGYWANVDHKDRDKHNNAISNLRLATPSQNSANRCLATNNTTGFKGVSRNRDKFEAGIKVKGKRIYLGLFDTPEEAHEAYKEATEYYFGEFANAAKQ